MSNLDAGTVVAYLAEAAAFACVVMVVYWACSAFPRLLYRRTGRR